MLIESLLIGFIIGFLLYEFYGVSPGGVITPAYFAINIKYPESIISTVVLAFIVLYIIKFLSSYLIIFGKRRLMISIMIGFLMKMIIDIYIINVVPLQMDIHTIGYVIPGLIANEFYRQGNIKTLLSMTTATVLTALILLLFIL